jgi:cobalt-zinc-cadmium efflux system outer membrane protein
MLRRFCLVLTMVFAVSLTVVADDTESVDDLLRQVLLVHPDLNGLQAALEAAQGESLQARARPNPTLTTEGGLKRVDADGDSEAGYALGLSLEQSMERGGKREARLAIANANERLAGLAIHLRRRELELDLRRLVTDYGLATAAAEAADEISRRSHALVDMLKQRPAAGAGLYLELTMVEASLIEFQATARRFACQRDLSRIELNHLLNRTPAAPLRVESITEPVLDLDTPANLVAKLKDGPRWAMEQVELERQEGELASQRLAAKSDYSVGPFVTHEDAGGEELSVGLSVSIDLPWRNNNQGGIAAAEARERQAQATQASVERSLTGALFSALTAYERACDDLLAIPLEKVVELHAAADLAERQYRLGTIPVQLFLDMQREYLGVQQLRHDALRSAWVSALDIQSLTGIGLRASPSTAAGAKP